MVVRDGFEPSKACAARFQGPSSYLEAWTISSPWLIIALGGGRLVSAPSMNLVYHGSRLGSGFPSKFLP